MGIALLFFDLFKWAEYIALMLGLYGFHLSIKIVLVYRKKKSKEAPNFKFDRGHSDKGGIGAVFFERMPLRGFLLESGFVAFFQKKLHP